MYWKNSLIKEKKPDSFIFDVDGTLTISRSKINPYFEQFFLDFCKEHKVYFITGSDRPKTLEQIGDRLYNAAQKVYQCNGADAWVGKKNVYTIPWTLPQDARNFLYQELKASPFPFRAGNHVEQRPGMINFSVIGRKAKPNERTMYVKFCKEIDERYGIQERFERKFPDIEAKVAGDTGIDIFPRGSNKAQVLKDFKNQSLVYFGDNITPGGNDFEIAEMISKNGGIYYNVNSYRETWNILKEII